MKTNREGLTFEEWCAAAGAFIGPRGVRNVSEHLAWVAWAAGEDPCEMRAWIDERARKREERAFTDADYDASMQTWIV